MSTVKVIAIVLVMLLINNLIIFELLDHETSDSDKVSIVRETENQAASSSVVLETKEQSDDMTHNEPNDNDGGKSAPQNNLHMGKQVNNQDDANFANSFQRFSHTEEFSQILRDYRRTETKRTKELVAQMAKMSASALYDLATTTDNSTDRYYALAQLTQSNDLKKLSTFELKELYQIEGLEEYQKSKMLTLMLNKNEPEALEWAKQLVVSSQNNRHMHIDSDVLVSIHEQDPEFINELANNIDLENFSMHSPLYSFLLNDSKLKNSFFQKNFEAILELDNADFFKYGGHGVIFEMTSEQQTQLAAVFDSDERHKRSFATNLVRNIDDIGLLRQSFAKLTRSEEKRSFIYSLLGNPGNQDQTKLVRELVADSDDPELAMIADQIESRFR